MQTLTVHKPINDDNNKLNECNRKPVRIRPRIYLNSNSRARSVILLTHKRKKEKKK
jgi:hypothetical protein